MPGKTPKGWADAAFSDYWSNVLWGGDWVSHATKWRVDRANNDTSESVSSLLTGKDWEIKLGDYILSLWTDWVWTKVQIYMRQFENFYQIFNTSPKTEYDYDIILNNAVELCDRMLADLIAMLFDDGIKWERAIAFTNIIDTNSTNNKFWTREEIFFKAFKIALWKSIIKNDAVCLNWETANLGENGKLVRALERYAQTLEYLNNSNKEKNAQLAKLSNIIPVDKNIQELIDLIVWSIDSTLSEIQSSQEFVQNLLDELELNLAWTSLGIKNANEEDEKLVEMEEWDIIIALSETPTKNWIISPRSNWMTLVRKLMKQILWDNWENKTFEEFLDVIWDKASFIPDVIKEKLSWLKMWDIATWETTVFNRFIAGDLLWWTEWKPIAKISWLRHWTWNPLFKLYSWLNWREDLMFDVDVSDLEIPDIFKLLQYALDISDEKAAEPWNMWLPFTIICKPWEEQKILDQALKSWITANVIWSVKKKTKWDPAVRMKWVWIGKSEIVYNGKKEEK